MHTHRLRRVTPIAVAVVVMALLTGGCSQQARAERDGRDLAKFVCDHRTASDSAAANAATAEILRKLDDIEKHYGAATAEDRADIKNNLADLAEHSVQGNKLLTQQDIAVIQRSADHLRNDAGQVQNAVWTGFADGLQECLAS